LSKEALFILPGCSLIFYAPSLDAPLLAGSAISFLLLLKKHAFISLLFLFIYFWLFNDKGVVSQIAFVIFFLFFKRLVKKFSVNLMLIFVCIFCLSFILLRTSGLISELISVAFEIMPEAVRHYPSLIASAESYGKYPPLVLLLSIVSTTSLTYTNYPLLFFIILIFLKEFFKKKKKNKSFRSDDLQAAIISAAIVFIFISSTMPNIALIRHYPFIIIILTLLVNMCIRGTCLRMLILFLHVLSVNFIIFSYIH